MESSQPRLERILRRWTMGYKYSSINQAKWTPFEDSESQSFLHLDCWKRPENRRFEVLSEKGTALGSVVIHTCQPNWLYRASTPWGDLEIRKSGFARYEVLQGSNLVGAVKERLPGRTAIVSFPMGQELRLKGSRLWSSNMKAETETGSVSVVPETGRGPNPRPNQSIRLKMKEFDMLPEEEKKAVVENDPYVQWRISLSGLLPARDDEILKVLASNLCRSRLYVEYAAALA